MRASTGGLLPNTRSLESTGLFDIKGLRWFYWTRKKPTKRCSLASIIFLGQKEKVSQEMINFFLFFLILTTATSSWKVSKEPPFGHKHLLLLFFCIYYFLILHISWLPHRWKGLDFDFFCFFAFTIFLFFTFYDRLTDGKAWIFFHLLMLGPRIAHVSKDLHRPGTLLRML